MKAMNILGGVLAALGVAASGAALAAPGVVVGGVDLRAGPGFDYPEIAPLPPGTGAEIFGCLPGWTWCDVAVDGPSGSVRGWAEGERLQVLYDNQPGYLQQYGPALGLPLIGFSIGNYWDRYYRGEPWYGSEGRWRGGDRGGYRGPAQGGPGPGGPDRGRAGFDRSGPGGPRFAGSGPGGPGGYGRPGERRDGPPGGYREPEAHGPGGPQPRPQQFGGGQPRPPQHAGGPGAPQERGGGHEAHGGQGDRRPN